jgi:hypothetical protein
MATHKKTKAKPKHKARARAASGAKPRAQSKAKHKAAAKGRAKPPARPSAGSKAPAKAKPAGRVAPARPPKGGKEAAKPALAVERPSPAGGAAGAPVPGRLPRPRSKKASRRTPFALRRGPDGQPLKPGDILLPGGPLSLEEVQYLFRGVIATQRPAAEAAYEEILAKRPATDPFANKEELDRQWGALLNRFTTGAVEAMPPNRLQPKRTFPGVIERAKQRRREIGSFLRGLDIGRTESSMMDSHGEASLQGLMEWAARLEKLADAEEPPQADYGQFHRGLDQLDHTTEALIVDVEATLRRLGSRARN